METRQSNPETTDDQGPSQARSYECNFCKRGFSNAQALGGHMNIHRKDKAKLKQESTEIHQQPFDISKTTPSFEIKSSEQSSTIGWPWILTGENNAISREETHDGELRQLPLFAERPSNTEDQKPSDDHFAAGTEKGLPSSHGSSGLELDLELRLGPEPQEDSSIEESTKNFF